MTLSNSISFMLPGLPPSFNRLYYPAIEHIGGRIHSEIKLRPEVIAWKQSMLKYVPPFAFSPGSLFRVDWTAYYPFKNKNGGLRKLDTSNFQSVLHNMIAARLGFDDSRIKWGSFGSEDAEERRVMVTVVEVRMEDVCQNKQL